MSLYEASAHLFYGKFLFRVGREAFTAGLPTFAKNRGAGEIVDLAVEDLLAAKGTPVPKITSKMSGKAYKAREDKLTELSFGCELISMGSSEVEDEAIYAVISESTIHCSSEDDHGGYGATDIEAGRLAIGQDWNTRLENFCELLQLGFKPGAPTWTISLYG